MLREIGETVVILVAVGIVFATTIIAGKYLERGHESMRDPLPPKWKYIALGGVFLASLLGYPLLLALVFR